jgi:serine/threonine-protein kinase
MGEVYLAEDTRCGRRAALKVMSAEMSRDAKQRKRFRTEAKAASGLSHPHICPILEVGETEDGRPYLAMEYVEGQTLQTVLQHHRLKTREVVRLGIAVASALNTAS